MPVEETVLLVLRPDGPAIALSALADPGICAVDRSIMLGDDT